MSYGLFQQIPFAYSRQRYACDQCGALLSDVEKHARWHGEVEADVEHALRSVYQGIRKGGDHLGR